MIKRLIIKNYKGIRNADISFRKGRNVIVGNNGVGKSTIIEALSLALGYGLNKFEINPYIFNNQSSRAFIDSKILPEILIEVYFDEQIPEFSGNNNSQRKNEFGIRLKICFDEDLYTELFESEKSKCIQIPCEYYKIERYWFSDQPVKQLLLPYNIQIVDSSSNYFNSSSNQYITHLLNKYISDDDLTKIRTGLRRLKDTFEEQPELTEVNSNIESKFHNLKVSIDVASRMLYREIICPYLNEIPISQIGAGDLCILKTILSLDKENSRGKDKILIIEEPESHLSHTKMYDLLQQIEDKLDEEHTQTIITTHNNFIANKLDLNNLILVENNYGNIELQRIDENTDKDVASFFTKISNYPTLRLILCKAAILVEGPTDEMILTYYFKKEYGIHPFSDGIEVICVEGVGFKQFVELGKAFHKKIAIITDNDGLNLEQLLAKRGLENLPENIKLFTDNDIKFNTTLEPSFISKNEDNLQNLSDLLRVKKVNPDNKVNLSEFMKNNKTLWAYKLLKNVDNTNFLTPDYIVNSVNWIHEDE